MAGCTVHVLLGLSIPLLGLWDKSGGWNLGILCRGLTHIMCFLCCFGLLVAYASRIGFQKWYEMQ